MKGYFGGCMNTNECGRVSCKMACDCVDPSRPCKQPCYKNCMRYEDCVQHGQGGKETTAEQWMNYVDQCVFLKPPPPLNPHEINEKTETRMFQPMCGCFSMADPPPRERPPPKAPDA